MAELPSLDDLNLPVLREIADGRRNSRECMSGVANHFGLGDDALVPQPGEGAKPRIMRRIAWSLVSLGAAGLIRKVKAGHYEVTEEGRRLVEDSPERLDHDFLVSIPAYAAVYGPGVDSAQSVERTSDTQVQ